MQAADPGSLSWLRFVFASVTVIALMAGLAWGLKFLSLRGWMKTGAVGTRLQILSSLAIDTRRRLLLVKHDGIEHLLLLGPAGDLLLSSKPATTEASLETKNK